MKQHFAQNFDIDKVWFEASYYDEEYETTTLRFIAPKDWHGDAHPKALQTEISVEYPTNKPEARYASVMMSCTYKTEDGFKHSDWVDVDLAYEHIEALITLAEIGEKAWRRKKYNNLLVQQIKDAGQELINRAETMVHPDLDMITDFSIILSFSQENFPEVSFSISVMNKTACASLCKKEVDI